MAARITAYRVREERWCPCLVTRSPAPAADSHSATPADSASSARCATTRASCRGPTNPADELRRCRRPSHRRRGGQDIGESRPHRHTRDSGRQTKEPGGQEPRKAGTRGRSAAPQTPRPRDRAAVSECRLGVPTAETSQLLVRGPLDHLRPPTRICMRNAAPLMRMSASEPRSWRLLLSSHGASVAVRGPAVAGRGHRSRRLHTRVVVARRKPGRRADRGMRSRVGGHRLDGEDPLGHHSAPAHTGSAQSARWLDQGFVHAAVVHGRQGDLPRVGRPVDRFVLTGWQVGLAGPAGMPVSSVATTGTHISTPVAS